MRRPLHSPGHVVDFLPIRSCPHVCCQPKGVTVQRAFVLIAALLGLALLPARSSSAPDLSAEQVQDARHRRLDGRHFTAEVDLQIERDGKREDRRLVVWRDDEGGKRERIMARFVAPADLRDFGLLFVENEGRPNDYFVHQPELGRVRRVSESVVSQDIYGVDLEFLGFGVAQSVRCEAEDVERVEINERPAYKLTERALDPNQRFDQRITWIDAVNWVALRTEHRRQGKPTLIAQVRSLEAANGVVTPHEIVFERPGVGEKVTMTVRKIDYETPIAPDFFSTLALIKRQ